MYPDFYYLLKALTGIELPALSLLKTFGFFVAIGFFIGGYIIYSELKRKEDAGIVGFTIEEITTGKPIHWTQLVGSALLGFIVGFKLIGMFLQWEIASPDPLQFLFSLQGNLLVGLIAAGSSFGLKYWENKKEVANGIHVKKVKTYPHIKVGDICIVAALGGFAGAKIFNALETWDSFIQDPLGSLFSSSGLTFYGGLIVATFLLWRYSKKINLDALGIYVMQPHQL
jgi:phosphatidylglycerol:prolipoprotein diacylglycerol transferase